jgi:hypothetical protein
VGRIGQVKRSVRSNSNSGPDIRRAVLVSREEKVLKERAKFTQRMNKAVFLPKNRKVCTVRDFSGNPLKKIETESPAPA